MNLRDMVKEAADKASLEFYKEKISQTHNDIRALSENCEYSTLLKEELNEFLIDYFTKEGFKVSLVEEETEDIAHYTEIYWR